MIQGGLIKDNYNDWITDYLDNDRHASALYISFDYFSSEDPVKDVIFTSNVKHDRTLSDGTVLNQGNNVSFYTTSGSLVDLDMQKIYHLSPDSFFHNHYRPFFMDENNDNDEIIDNSSDISNWNINDIKFRLSSVGENELTNVNSFQNQLYSNLYPVPDGYNLTWNRIISIDSEWQENNTVAYGNYDNINNIAIQNLLKDYIFKSITDDSIRLGNIDDYISLTNIKEITDNNSDINSKITSTFGATIEISGTYNINNHDYNEINVDSNVDYHYDYDRLAKPNINPLDCPYFANLAHYLTNSTDALTNEDDILSFNLAYQLSVSINNDATTDYSLEVIDRIGINNPNSADSDNIIENDTIIVSELI